MNMEAQSVWKVKKIREGDYGCEERQPGEKVKVLVTVENEQGENALEPQRRHFAEQFASDQPARCTADEIGHRLKPGKVHKEKLGEERYCADGENNGHRAGKGFLGFQFSAFKQQRHQHHAAAAAE